MIINNYNNSLAENKESNLTFFSRVSPCVYVRSFEYNLIDGDHLVIPYYVSDSKHRDYVGPTMAADGETYYHQIGQTFTTIIRLDEDSVDDSDVREWKKTTYAGEQVIDLGAFTLDESNVDGKTEFHTFSIRTIQSNGIGSATKYYRFAVRKPVNTVLDLSEQSEFESSFNGFTKYWFILDGGAPTNVEEEFNADYSVSVIRDTSDNVVDIEVTVSDNATGLKGITRYNITNTGERATRNGVYSKVNEADIAGVYSITTHCEVNGSTVNLIDYIDVDPSDLPDSVVLAAASNKVALTRLFEAAKAYGADTLRLPENMVIVIDYHSRENRGINDLTGNTDPAFLGRDDIRFPDGITIDMNNAVIRVLRCTNAEGGRLLHMVFNRDTHLMNMKIVNNWKHHIFGNRNAESLYTIGLHSCLFCSVNNIDYSYGIGYDMNISNYIITPSLPESRNSKTEKPPFTVHGYIDYDGVEHNYDDEDSDVHGVFYTGGTDYDDGGMRRVMESGIVNSYNTICVQNNTSDAYSTYSNFRLWGRELFIHFYDINKEFIKTVKVYERWPVIMPKGAWYARLTCYGSNRVSKAADSLNKYNSNETELRGMQYIDLPNYSWCSGAYNCNGHDTRTCTMNNGGVQTKIKNCKFWNISGERTSVASGYVGDYWYISKILFDVEENRLKTFNYAIEDCEFLYGDVNGVTVGGGYDLHFKNCHNIHFALGGLVSGCLIEDSNFSVEVHESAKSADPNIMIRNCIVSDVSHTADEAFGIGNNTDLWIYHNSVLRTSGELASNIHNEQSIKYI